MIEFDGLSDATTFADLTDIPEGCKIEGDKWVCKWKSDPHDTVDRVKARMVVRGVVR